MEKWKKREYLENRDNLENGEIEMEKNIQKKIKWRNNVYPGDYCGFSSVRTSVLCCEKNVSGLKVRNKELISCSFRGLGKLS